MPNACVYLHELIDIVGTGSEAYKAHTGMLGAKRDERAGGDGGAPLVGTWQQSGSTGTWPLVVNLWEMRDWDHWAVILERQYTRASGQEPALKKWWTQATRYRSGGFDRILEPAPWSPTRRELIEEGVRGRACVQEIVTVRPGTAEQYLEAVATHWRPQAARLGLRLTGAWRTTMRDTEAVLFWCLAEFGDLTRYLAASSREPGVRAWHERAREWRTDYRETLLVPSVWCVTHPDWRAAERDAPRRAGARRATRARR